MTLKGSKVSRAWRGFMKASGLGGFGWWGGRTVPPSGQGLCRHPEPFSPSAHCAWQVLEGGLPSWGKAGATSHAVFCSSGDSHSGTALRQWAAPRAPAAPEYRNLCTLQYSALGGCSQSQAAVHLSLCMEAFLPWQPLVSPWNSEELSLLPELLSQLVRRNVAKNGGHCHSRNLLPNLWYRHRKYENSDTLRNSKQFNAWWGKNPCVQGPRCNVSSSLVPQSPITEV